MAMSAHVTALSQTIQLALAPAFLLVATGSLLNVMTGRLARIVDRARTLEDKFVETDGAERGRVVWELRRLETRMRLVNTSIGLTVGCAILVCLMVAGLFIVEIGQADWNYAIGWLFIVAMILLSAGLILFLLEVRHAGKTLHVREEYMERTRK